MKGIPSPKQQGKPIISIIVQRNNSTPTIIHMSVHLELTHHTIVKMNTVLTAMPN